MQFRDMSHILREITSVLSPDLLRKNNLDPSGSRLRMWKDLAIKVTSILDTIDLEYTLMKAFDVPYAFMADVDLLIENESDMLKTLAILEKENYQIKKLQFFYPYKLNAVKPDQTVIVDIYYKPKWYDFTYAPSGLISSSRIRSNIHGVDAFIPSPELNIYIVATHGYCHGRFTLEEILHIINVILKEKPNLSSLVPLTKRFQTGHALYCYLWLVKNVLKEWFGIENSDLEHFLDKLLQNSLTSYFENWINTYTPIQYKHFPIYIPLKMLAYSSFTKFSKNGLDSSVKRYDEMLITLRHFFLSGFLYEQFGQILTRSF